MVELTIVTAIILTVSATALPSIVQSMYNVKLRSSASSLAGLMQSARMQAIRDNRYYFVCYAAVNGTMRAWVSRDNACTASTELASGKTPQQIQLGGNVQIVTSGMPGGLNTGFPLPSGTLATAKPAFNARGLPCYRGTTGRCDTIGSSSSGIGFGVGQVVSYTVYMTDTRPMGQNGWAAVSVSPAGRTQVWVYGGGTSWGR